MPSNYPVGPDNLPADHVDDILEIIRALHVNRLDEAVNALMGELGNVPSGTYSSVRARLDATGEGVPSVRDDRDLLTVASDGSTRWSAKAAPYNICENTGATPGADPTGAADSTASINAVLTAASGNGPVLAPTGFYKATQILAPSNTTLIGHGIGKTIIQASATGGAHQVLRNSDWTNGNTNIHVEGIEFDGNKAARGAVAGLGALIEWRGAPTWTTPARRIITRDCLIRDSHSIGIAHQAVWEASVIGCVVKDNMRDGIYFKGACRYNEIVGNHIVGSGDDHISYHGGPVTAELSSDCAIVGNTIGTAVPDTTATVYSAGGITVSGSENVTVSGNTIRGGEGWGVKAWNNGVTTVRNLVISNNTIRNIGSATSQSSHGVGIWLEVDPNYGGAGTGSAEIRNVVIQGNTVDNSWYHGIVLKGLSGFEVQNVEIDGNLLSGRGGVASGGNSGGDGINLSQYCRYIRIRGGSIRDFANRGIYMGPVTSTYVDIDGTQVFNNCRQNIGGVGIDAAAVTNYSVRGVRAFDGGAASQGYAFGWGSSSNGLLMGNNFKGNTVEAVTGSRGVNFERHNIDNGGQLRDGPIMNTDTLV